MFLFAIINVKQANKSENGFCCVYKCVKWKEHGNFCNSGLHRNRVITFAEWFSTCTFKCSICLVTFYGNVVSVMLKVTCMCVCVLLSCYRWAEPVNQLHIATGISSRNGSALECNVDCLLMSNRLNRYFGKSLIVYALM